jgi:hypothetical protein
LADEGKLQEEAERADKAQLLLAEPLIIGALEACKAKAHELFYAATKPDEAMRARDYLEAMDWFIKDFKNHVRTGTLAKQQLKDIAAATASKVARLIKRRAYR